MSFFAVGMRKPGSECPETCRNLSELLIAFSNLFGKESGTPLAACVLSAADLIKRNRQELKSCLTSRDILRNISVSPVMNLKENGEGFFFPFGRFGSVFQTSPAGLGAPG